MPKDLTQNLNRDERSMINRMANNLSQRAYNAYRFRLIELAAVQKQRTGHVDLSALEDSPPDITDLMESL